MENKQIKEVELDQDFIVLAIPKDTVEVEITAKVWHGGEVVTVGNTMSFDDVRAAFKEAREGYIPADAIFTLNPYYDKTKLEQLVGEYLAKLDEDEDL